MKNKTSKSTSFPEGQLSLTDNSSQETSPLSIKLKFRPSKKEENKGTLYFQFIQDRHTTKVNTPYQIFSSEWDTKSQQIIIPDTSNAERSAELKAISSDLKWDLTIIERMSQVNPDVKTLIDNYRKSKAFGEDSVFQYIRRIIDQHLEEGNLRAAETFQTTLNSFMRFRGGVDLSYAMITKEVIEDYQKYQVQRNLSMNTISFYNRKLRAAYNRAVNENLCQDIKPFATVYTGTEETKKRAINPTELKVIANADLSATPKLELARDIFILILSLQGISFIDLAFMPQKDENIGILTYNRRKTGSPISIHLEPEAKEIINKYHGEDTPYMLNIVSSTDPKTARQECMNALARINYSLEKLAEHLELDIHITTYSARHTWATLAMANGANLETVSQALGHKDLKTTRIYIDSIHSDAVTKANRGVLDTLKGE